MSHGDTHSGKTQRGRILALLIKAASGWVPLPEILALGIAQYNARVHELRALGFRIENRKERVNGLLHTYFRLNGGSATIAKSRTEPQPESGSLFGSLAPDRSYKE
jgi:hypothetical protein